MSFSPALMYLRCSLHAPPCVCVCVLKDLVYEYSIRVGDRPPRMLYQGRDFQYYFSLPSGDPKDDYKGKDTHTHTDS